MIFIDGELWPPSLHGTGTEDYFNAAWGFPRGQYAGPYHGISLGSNPQEHFGLWSMYRFHIEDPVRFQKSIKQDRPLRQRWRADGIRTAPPALWSDGARD